MQLSLSFEYEELKKTPLTKEDFSQISEFEQGNFTSAIYSRFTADEIAKILLKSELTLPELKIALLKQRGVCANRLDTEINETYKDHIKSHNDSVRAALKISYAGKTKKRLKKNGFDKFRKYNNAYWDFYGGKSSSKISVTDENHEWHDKYLKEEKMYLHESLAILCGADISDRDEIHTYYMQVFGEDEYRDARDEYFRSSIIHAIKSGNLESLHNLYTKAFGETYCADSLDGIEITESQKAYLMALWNIPIITPIDTKDNELSVEQQSEKKFKDPTTSLLYTNMDKLDEVHAPYLTRLKKGYWEMIISMNLSEEQLSHIFKWFLGYIMTNNDGDTAIDLFSYCVDTFGREEINNLLFRKLQKSDAPLSNEEVSIVYKLAQAYLRRSS